jgi:hypothetical protein
MGRHTEHFMSEGTHLIDFEGDLEEMEQDYHERLNALVANDQHHLSLDFKRLRIVDQDRGHRRVRGLQPTSSHHEMCLRSWLLCL